MAVPHTTQPCAEAQAYPPPEGKDGTLGPCYSSSIGVSSHGRAHEHSASTARIHGWARRRGGMAARGARAATRDIAIDSTFFTVERGAGAKGSSLGSARVVAGSMPHADGLLRARRERPRRRAAEPNDEFAPSKAKPHLPLLSPTGALSRQNSTAKPAVPGAGACRPEPVRRARARRIAGRQEDR